MLLLLASLVMPMPTEYFCRYSMRNRASNNIWFVYHGFIVRIRSVRSCEPHWLGIGNQLNSWQNRFFSSNFPFFQLKFSMFILAAIWEGFVCAMTVFYWIYILFTWHLQYIWYEIWRESELKRILGCCVVWLNIYIFHTLNSISELNMPAFNMKKTCFYYF